MYFEKQNINFDDKEKFEEFYYPLEFQIEKLKEEKENLEEYVRFLIFTNKIFDYILSNNNYYSSERRTFTFEPSKEEYHLIEALNILLNDTPSHQKNFSFEEINDYSNRIKNEINITEQRIDRIISQLKKYDKDSEEDL